MNRILKAVEFFAGFIFCVIRMDAIYRWQGSRGARSPLALLNFQWVLHGINDDDFKWPLGRLDFQSKLLNGGSLARSKD